MFSSKAHVLIAAQNAGHGVDDNALRLLAAHAPKLTTYNTAPSTLRAVRSQPVSSHPGACWYDHASTCLVRLEQARTLHRFRWRCQSFLHTSGFSRRCVFSLIPGDRQGISLLSALCLSDSDRLVMSTKGSEFWHGHPAHLDELWLPAHLGRKVQSLPLRSLALSSSGPWYPFNV